MKNIIKDIKSGALPVSEIPAFVCFTLPVKTVIITAAITGIVVAIVLNVH